MIKKPIYLSKSRTSKPTVNHKDKKKIGFISGVAFIISAVIGVGIFLKNGQILSFNLGNFTLTILSWLLCSLAVISLGLSLLVIAAKTNSELGILQWARDFLSPGLFQMIKFYFLFLYVPLIISGDSFYFLQALQQAFPSWHLHWFYAWIISFSVVFYFFFMNAWKPRMILVHAYLAFYIKLFPIVFFAIIALILYLANYDDVQGTSEQLYNLNSSGYIQIKQDDINSFYYSNPMLLYGPEIGFFLSVPAMFFAYDGFYYVVSIRKQLKEPSKSPSIILAGIFCVMVIFILITLSLLLSTNVHDDNRGTVMGVSYLYSNSKWRIVNSILNIAICIGCLGIISSSINFSLSLYKELIITHDLPFSKKILAKTNWSFSKLAYVYLYSYIIFFILLISMIGTFGFLNLDNYNFGYYQNARIDQLYSFINTITNWESLFTFATFVFIILGSWKALKHKKITFTKRKKKILFLVESGIGLFVIGFAVIFSIINATGDFIIVLKESYFYDQSAAFYNMDNLIGTKIMINNSWYECFIKADKVEWTDLSTKAILQSNVQIQIKQVLDNNNNINPYLFSLIANQKDWLSHTISSSLITKYSLYHGYLFSNSDSIFANLLQDFIGQIINFVILVVIISSCVLYSYINALNAKRKSWFATPHNIFHNKELEIHL